VHAHKCAGGVGCSSLVQPSSRIVVCMSWSLHVSVQAYDSYAMFVCVQAYDSYAVGVQAYDSYDMRC
jgi:hypothetical protein